MTDIKLILGDCLEKLKEIPDGSVDAVITDPPYGVNKADWDGEQETFILLGKAFAESSRILKKDGILAFFVPTRNILKFGGLASSYLPYKWMFIWNSPNNMIPGALGFSKYTSVLIHSNGSVFRNIQDSKSVSWKPEKINHPTVKPLPIMAYLLKLTKEGDTILDPFMGSGTTGVACAKLNRNFIGIEIDEGYFKIAERRIGEWKGQERLELSK